MSKIFFKVTYHCIFNNAAVTDIIRVHHKHKGCEDILASASNHKSKPHKLCGEDHQKLGRCYIEKYQPNDEDDNGQDSNYKQSTMFLALGKRETNCCTRMTSTMALQSFATRRKVDKK